MTHVARWVLAGAVLLVVWEGARGARAFWYELQGFRPRRGPVARPDDAAQLGLGDVSFRSRDGGVVHAWYVPSRTGAAIVLCHGSGSDRRSVLPEARALSALGAGLLLFDWPGHGESAGGAVHFGAAERAALEGAVDFLERRPDVDPHRIGALGASMGSYLLAQVAPADRRIRAVVLEGAFGDAIEQTRAEYQRWGIVRTWGALLAIRVGGMDVHALRPIDHIADIAPRPLVIVAGTADVTVPMELSRRLYDVAREPKELWVIDGAGHGDYGTADETYGARLRAFFDGALRAEPGGSAEGAPAAGAGDHGGAASTVHLPGSP